MLCQALVHRGAVYNLLVTKPRYAVWRTGDRSTGNPTITEDLPAERVIDGEEIEETELGSNMLKINRVHANSALVFVAAARRVYGQA